MNTLQKLSSDCTVKPLRSAFFEMKMPVVLKEFNATMYSNLELTTFVAYH